MSDKSMLATVVNYGIPETDKEHLQVLVEFAAAEVDGQPPVQKFWYGSLHPNARKYTLEGLFACGMKGNDPTILLEPGALEIGRTVEIVVGPDTYNGKTRERVKWVNPPGASRRAAPMDVVKARSKLSGMVEFVKAQRKEYEAKHGPVAKSVSTEDVPF